MSNPRSAAIYVRISDDRLGDAAGVGRQEQDARALADRFGWQVGPVLVENDTSAFKRRKVVLPNGQHELRALRPRFRELVEMIMDGSVDGLIVYDLDRVARDPRDLEDLIDAVEQRKPRLPVESVTGSLRLANDADVTMARVLVAVANKSSRDTARRTKRKNDELAAQGRWAGGPRRYGYEADGVTIRPAEAKVIRWAAKKVVEGRSLASLARELDRRGVPSARGGAWSYVVLGRILRSPSVAGLREHHGNIIGKAQWPAVLTAKTHDAVVSTLERRKVALEQPPARWCQHLLICGHCNRPLTCSRTLADRPYRYWCKPRSGGCGRITVTGPPVDAELERQVLSWLEQSDVVAAADVPTVAGIPERLQARIEADEEQLRVLARMWATGELTLVEYREARPIILRRLDAARQVNLVRTPEQVQQLLAAANIAEAWAMLEEAAKREVAQTLLAGSDYLGWQVNPADPTKARRFDPGRLELVKRLSMTSPRLNAGRARPSADLIET